jgi:hypothetical protein
MAQVRFVVRVLATLAVLGALAGVPVAGAPAAGLQAAARISPEEAASIAVNELQAVDGGFQLRNPRHLATFGASGLAFAPRGGGPEWGWHLREVLAGKAPLRTVAMGEVQPIQEGPTSVAYRRGALVEQYLGRGSGLEQQFVIPRALALDGADLVIAGAVQCAGSFEATDEGWQWGTADGAVHLGDVRVYDSAGRELPATMEVTASSTRIVVEGVALAEAAYPVTIDPEIGANDFRISSMGSDVDYAALTPDVAYNSHGNQYLVVWAGDDNGAGLAVGEREIWGQRVNALNGVEIGTEFRLSDVGTDGDSSRRAVRPAVAYNSTDHQYLVVWHADDDGTAGLPDEEFEIYGQLLGANGSELGDNDFRISDMGPDLDDDFDALFPDVAYNSTDNQYLVVWHGDDDTGSLVEGENEIYGQLLAADGTELGSDRRLSDMGSDGDASFDAEKPAVAYNSTDNLYLVVWYGDDVTSGDLEIYGQLLAANGTELGSDTRLSDMGSSEGDTSYPGLYPDVAYNTTQNEFLVVWEGSDDDAGMDPGEREIFGQRVDKDGAEVSPNDFRISDMGPTADPDFEAEDPAVTYDGSRDEYLVVWSSDDDTAPLVDDEYEIFGQRLDKDGAEVGPDDFRISDMGPDGNTAYDAYGPAVAFNSTNDSYLAVWYGDDNTAPLVEDEYEIFGKWMHLYNGGTMMSADLRLSDMGSDEWYDADSPAVAYNSTDDEYFVVWYGDDNSGSLIDGEYEIYGRRVNAAAGVPMGPDLRLSDMGSSDGDADYTARDPDVAYNSTDNVYLVVWRGDDDTAGLINNEYEIFGQLVAADGSELYANDRRLSLLRLQSSGGLQQHKQ